jgi:hypothetical protein
MNQNLANLVRDQTELQIEGETIRFNTLDTYSLHFGFNPISYQQNEDMFFETLDIKPPKKTKLEKQIIAEKRKDNELWREKGIKRLLEDYIKQKGSVVWADLGCGNGIALRQGKIYLESIGIDPSKLHAYGYDALPPNRDEIKRQIMLYPKDYNYQLLLKRNEPIIKQMDIATVKFEEKPDIITAFDVLFWTKNPLKIFANAIKQSNLGATICLNRTEFMMRVYNPKDNHPEINIFEKICSNSSTSTGISAQYVSRQYAILKKISENQDFTFGYKLHHRSQRHPQAFCYFYSPKNK